MQHSELSEPSGWIKAYLPLISQNGRVLDLACGSGRHSLLLAKAAYSVLAVDRDTHTLDLLKQAAQQAKLVLETQVLDLETSQWPFSPSQDRQFDGIVVTNYLHRPIMPNLVKLLKEGGVLLYETFAHGNAEFGKPSNPNFLLQAGELLEFAQQNQLYVIAYQDGYTDTPKPARVQRLCASLGIPRWGLKSPLPLQFAG